MTDSIFSLGSAVVIVMAAYALGRPIVRGIGLRFHARTDLIVWAVAFGLVVGGTAIAGAGLLGWYYRPVLGITLYALAFWGFAVCLQDLQDFSVCRAAKARGSAPAGASIPARKPTVCAFWHDDPLVAPWSPPGPWLSWPLTVAVAMALVGAFVTALAPPTAGDALCYHLELPKRFFLERRLVMLPEDANSTSPLLLQMWFLAALAIDSAVAASLVHTTCGLLLAMATAAMARPMLGDRWCWIAAGLLLLTPGIGNQMGAPLTDLAVALLATLAVAAWWRVLVDEGGLRWMIAAGLAAGGALAIKMTAGLFVIALILGTLLAGALRAQHRAMIVRAVAVAALVAVVASGFWYGRAAVLRGNPVHPFLSEITSLASQSETDSLATKDVFCESKAPMGHNLLAVLRAPWEVTMSPDRFGGRGHQLGGLYLAVLPGLLIARRLRGLRLLLLFATSYLVVWCLLRQNIRFLFPIVPVLAVACAWVLLETRRIPGRPRRIMQGVVLGLFAFSAAVGLWHARDTWRVASGFETREDYLARCEPSWLAARRLDAAAGNDGHLLTQDYRNFYFTCRVTREASYRHRTAYDRDVPGPGALAQSLRGRGFTHLLLVENQSDRGAPFDRTLTSLVDAAIESGEADVPRKLIDYRFERAGGATLRYRLFALEDSSSP